jgi:hypothetical protein
VRQAFAPVATETIAEEEQPYAEEGEQYYEYEQEQPEEKEEQAGEAFEPFKPKFEEKPSGEAGEISLSREEKQPQEKAEEKTGEKTAEAPKPQRERIIKKPHIHRPEPMPTIPDTFTLSPITPDRHIGRRFTSMLPSEGELILPVRGEKVLQTSEEIDIQDDINEKTEQLKHLLDQIKDDQELPPVAPTEAPQPQSEKVPEQGSQQISEAQGVVKKVKEENERLTNQIEKLKKDLDASQQSDTEKEKKLELIKKLEEEKEKTTADYTSLQRQVHELQKRLEEKEKPEQPQSNEPKKPTYAKMQAITNDPNTVSGIVKNQDGEAIPGVVLLIKNHKGESVRALKTNAIGQFSISTPLGNGLYTLEVGSSVEGLTFDIITVEVKGEVLPPIEIIGRPI